MQKQKHYRDNTMLNLFIITFTLCLEYTLTLTIYLPGNDSDTNIPGKEYKVGSNSSSLNSENHQFLGKDHDGKDNDNVNMDDSIELFELYDMDAPISKLDYSPSSSSTKPHSKIMILAIGVCATVIILVGIVVVLMASVIIYKKKNHILQKDIRALTAKEVKDFYEGDPNVNLEEALPQEIIHSIPFDTQYEISMDQMIIAHDKIIGSGAFGHVIHGFVRLVNNDQIVPVAIKTVKPDLEVNYFKTLLSELKIMIYLGKHKNIVDLVGTCTASIKECELFIALELCPLGSLEEYLRKGRDKFSMTDSDDPDVETEFQIELENTNNTTTIGSQNLGGNTNNDLKLNSNLNSISFVNLLNWSKDIANAMKHLTEKKVIHGDLATRNVLLTANRVAKISDFGLSRQLLNYEHYMKKSKTPLPWRWLAIECFKEKRFSVASDVWAFGVTMWEIFSLAEMPFAGWPLDCQFVEGLLNGNRLRKPRYANQPIFQVMQDCWKLEPCERPSFDEIHCILNEIQNPDILDIEIKPSNSTVRIEDLTYTIPFFD